MSSFSSVAIIDCGGQYTKVIDRRVRELQVHSEILPLDVTTGELERFDAIILSGGPNSVYSESAPAYDPAILSTGKPTLGICYGMQLLTLHHGGEVAAGGQGEYGVEDITVDPANPLFRDLGPTERVLMSHGDSVTGLPAGFRVGARSRHAVAAIWNEDLGVYGVQFHPEVDLTENGMAMLRNFLVDIAGLAQDYVLSGRIEDSVHAIRKQVGDNPVLAFVSGGVDSAVTAALLLKALPASQVYALHVDTGFMRKDESAGVVEGLRQLGLTNLSHVDASDLFYSTGLTRSDGTWIPPLVDLHDPELKRELVGSLFMDVLRDELNRLNLDFDRAIFAQGTLRPDLIESGNPGVSKVAQSIKTHHNDVPLVRVAREQGRVVETNADWHKDEVRQVARELGLDEEIAARQPFPGPGLVLRVVTWDGSDAPPIDLDSRISTGLAGLQVRTLPFRTVGVQGDYRSHRYLLAVQPDDLANPVLNRLGQQIAGSYEEINRVAIVLDARLPLMELQAFPSTINRPQVDLLREVDARARHDLADLPSSQLFCVIMPLGSAQGRYSIALRAIITNDFMTGRHAGVGTDFPVDRLQTFAASVLRDFPEVDAVFYDVTGKPPATVEWQ